MNRDVTTLVLTCTAEGVWKPAVQLCQGVSNNILFRALIIILINNCLEINTVRITVLILEQFISK